MKLFVANKFVLGLDCPSCSSCRALYSMPDARQQLWQMMTAAGGKVSIAATATVAAVAVAPVRPLVQTLLRQ